jgi:hypothetical protein
MWAGPLTSCPNHSHPCPYPLVTTYDIDTRFEALRRSYRTPDDPKGIILVDLNALYSLMRPW